MRGEKQKGVIKVLQVRAMFEDYGNHALDDHRLVGSELIWFVKQQEKWRLERQSLSARKCINPFR